MTGAPGFDVELGDQAARLGALVSFGDDDLDCGV